MATTIGGTSGGTTLSNPLYAGQSFTISAGGFDDDIQSESLISLSSAPLQNIEGTSFDHITFNFYNASTSAPYAIGTGYLFSQAYRGTPSQLSSSSVGLLGTATSDGSVYTFAPTLTLSAGVDYFFYEDALLQPLSGNSTYTAGASFAASSSSSNFSGPLPTLNFQVNGSPAPLTVTPEPSTFTLLGTGILVLGGAVRRRFMQRPPAS